MNKVVRDMIMRRRRDNDSRRGDSRRGRDNNYDRGYDKGYDRGYDEAYDEAYDKGYDEAYDRAYRDGFDSGYDEAHERLSPYGNRGMTVEDGRRGVRGTGRYGIGGSMYRGRRDRASEEMYLTKEDMKEWKENLSMGEHFSLPQVEQAMQSLRIEPKEYTEEELCLMANALYSDYYKTLKNIIPKEKEVMYYTSMAKDFLEDDDASVKGGEKAAIYYLGIVKE